MSRPCLIVHRYPRGDPRRAARRRARWARRSSAGLLDGGCEPDALAVAEVDADRRRDLEARFPKVRVVPSAAWAVADADVVVVAVKPGDVAAALDAALARARASDALVLSIAAGVTIATLEAARAGPARRAGHAEHARARRAGRLGDRARATATEDAPRARRAAARRGRHRRARRRAAARRRHRALGLGSGVRVPRRRGADRGRRARRPAPPDRRRSSSSRRCSGSATLLADGDEGPEALRAAVTSPGRHDRGRAARRSKQRGVRAAFLDAVVAGARNARRNSDRRTPRPWTSEVRTMKAAEPPAASRRRAPAAPPPAPPPIPPTIEERFVRARIAGKVTSPGPRELRHQVEKLDANPVEAWAAIRAVFGATVEESQIDPVCTTRAARVAGARIGAVARAGGRIAFATAQPASLLGVHSRAGSPRARACGGSIDDTEDAGPIRVDGRGPRWLRWIDGVAVVTDGASAARHDRAGRGRGVDVPLRPPACSSSPTVRSRVSRGPRRRRGRRLRRARPDRSRHPRGPGAAVRRGPGPQRPVTPAAYEPLTTLLETAIDGRCRRASARNSESTQAPRGTLDNFGRSGIQSVRSGRSREFPWGRTSVRRAS